MNQAEIPQNYDWGRYLPKGESRAVQVLDTSLRDGLQSVGIRHPNSGEKEEFVERLIGLGIDAIDVAMPIAGGVHLEHAIKVGRKIPSHIAVTCLTRTTPEDIRAAADFSQSIGRQVEAIIFCGASPLRRAVEEWEVSQIVEWMSDSVNLALKEGLTPIVATEHTTQTEPGVLSKIYRAGLDLGARKVCIADTSGVADPPAAYNIVSFFEAMLAEYGEDITIDWHGHNDLGLALASSLAALKHGVDRVHVTTLRIGERTGNTSLEEMLINLKIAGDPRRQDLTKLVDFAKFSSRIFNKPIPDNYPGVGENVFNTASGIHAAAELKAFKFGGISPYSAVDPRELGRETGVRVGPMSGRKNLEFMDLNLGLGITDAEKDEIITRAKEQNRLFDCEEVADIIGKLRNK